MRPSAICFLLNVLNSRACGMAVARPYGFEIDFEINLEEIRDKITRSQRRKYLTPPAWELMVHIQKVL